jgi:hypothetical protein
MHLLKPRSPWWWLLALVLAFALLLTWKGAARAAEDIRATMRGIFAQMQILLPLSASDSRFSDPGRQAEIRDALRALESNAKALDQHAWAGDVETEHLAESLAQMARTAAVQHAHGNSQSARSLVARMTSACIACHTRLSAARDAPIAEHFIASSEIAALPLAERARIQVATRRFDESLASFEALLGAEDVPAVDLIEPLADYLVVCLRVKGDAGRALATLGSFAGRADLWEALRDDVRHWMLTLETYSREGLPSAPSLADAEKLLDRARSTALVPYSRLPLIDYIVASRLLHQYVRDSPGADAGLAQAYYLLGIAEYGIGRSYWLGLPELFLRSAIMAAPGSLTAQAAYGLLEEQTILGFTGSSGTRIPPAVQEELESLRRIAHSL